MLRVGLTGGIACGKSRVRDALSAAGLPTLDLDQVAHEVLQPGGAAYGPVVEAFGTDILDASSRVDRKKLGAIVFGDPAARQRLNALTHPRIRDAEAAIALGWERAGERVGVVDAALLVETGAHLRFSRLVVVHCPRGVQLARLMARDGIDRSAAEARLSAQMPIDDKRWFGHFDVDTSGRLEETDARARELASALRDLAEGLAAPSPHAPERLLGALAAAEARGPGGLSPIGLLEELGTSGGLDLARLAGLLAPPAQGAWYEARVALPGPGPQALAPALAAWSALRAQDDACAAAAMGSLARLLGAASRDAAAAVFLTVAFLHLVEAAQPLTGVRAGEVAAWVQLGERWGGGPVPKAVIDLVARMPFLPAQPDAARRLAEANGWDADGAAALAGLCAGATGAEAPRAAQALARVAAAS